MKKENKTVRMAGETKHWLDELIFKEQIKLNERIRSGLVNDLEEKISSDFSEQLKGLSLNINLNVTAGSIIEKAYFETQKCNWEEIARSLKQVEETSEHGFKGATPKLSLDVDVLRGLELYQLEFQRLEVYSNAQRPVKLSYVIKLVIYAYWLMKN